MYNTKKKRNIVAETQQPTKWPICLSENSRSTNARLYRNVRFNYV